MSRQVRRSVTALAGAFLALAAPDLAPAITRASISVDGSFADWAIVLRDSRNYIADQSTAGGDPDRPGTADRDLRLFAATWDDTWLYLYYRRTDSGSNSVTFLAYVDLDDDQRLGATDLILEVKATGASIQSVGAYRYVPAASPSDAITGDGVDEPGSLGAAVVHDITARTSAVGVEMEARISWASLGLTAGKALNFHPSISQGTSLPGQVEDNGAPLTTRFREMTLLADRRANTTSPGQSSFSHVVTATGNQSDTFNLTANSPGGFRVALLSDPDCDGDPADGVLVSDDLNGNGIYTDVGDVLNPVFDSDANSQPDTGLVAAGASFCFVARVTVPGGVPNGTEDRLRLIGASVNLGTLFALNFDTTIVGLMAISPDRSKLAVAGTDVWYPHHICNLSGAADDVNLSATSSQSYPVVLWSDPNGDGNPSDGVPISSTGSIADGTCVSIVAVVSVPAGAALGTVDTTTVTGSLVLQPAVIERAVDQTTVARRLTIVADSAAFAAPGGSAFYPATITNAWYETAVLDISSSSSLAGAKVTIWSDPNGDGDPSDGEPIQIAGGVPPNGGTQNVVVQVDIPLSARQGDVDTSVVTVAERNDPGVTASVTEVTSVRTMATFADASRLRYTTTFPRCVTVYARANALDRNLKYRFEWLDSLGTLKRIFPNAGANPDANGQMDDQISITATDPIGAWSVRIRRKSGNQWLDVTPGGSADFLVTDDLGDEGGLISTLSTDKLNYTLVGDSLTATAILENPSNITYTNSYIDYVVFRDGNGDELPSAGETYITLAGTSASWTAGQTTCKTTGLPDILPADRYLDQSCTVVDIQFTTSGVWNLCTTWFTQCGTPIAIECVKFNVGCAPGDLPAADAGGDRAICLGQSTQLGTPGQAGLTYDWTPTSYLDDPTIARPAASPDITLGYTVTVTNPATGCVNTSRALVTVNPLPGVDAGPDALVCGSTPEQIGVDPGPGVTCRWSPSVGLVGPDLCRPMAQPAATTDYTVTWTITATGCQASDTMTVRVVALPPADAGPDVFLCTGTPGVTIGGPAQPGLVYRWSPITDLSDPNAAQTLASPATTTTYTLTVTDTSTGCTGTDRVTVTPGGPIARSGGPGPVTGPTTIGVPPCDSNLEYTWQPVTGLSDPTICNPVAAPTSTTTYCLTVRDRTSGCVSAADCITVEPGSGTCTAVEIPAAIARLVAARRHDFTPVPPARTDDVYLEWQQDPRALGGYRGYAVLVKTDIPNAKTVGRLVFSTAPSVSDSKGVDPGVLTPPRPARELFFYQVAGVCRDGASLGPL